MKRLPRVKYAGLLIILVACCGVGLATASVKAAPGWTNTTRLADRLEEQGVAIKGRHFAVDSASCLGLRRYGHKPFGSIDTAYHRFKCSIELANAHSYTLAVTITRSVVSLKPVADEPASVTAYVRDAEEELAAKRKSIEVLGPDGAQKAAIAKYLRPYVEAVATAKASAEPYRTRFWMKITSSVQTS